MLKLSETAAVGEAPRYNAKSVGRGAEQVLLRRRLRWLRRRTIQRLADWERAQVESWDEVPTARLAKCGRVAWREFVEVHGLAGDDGLSAFPVGVVACASAWSCPCCSAVIRTRRSLEVQAAAMAHAEQGGELVMLTLTIRHNRRQSLEELLDVLKSSWRSIQTHRAWKSIRPQLIGSITATEVTWGENGWHPHLHLLLFLPEGSTVGEELAGWLPAVWRSVVGRALPGSTPDLRHGVNLTALDASAAEYVSKLADETTRADLKGDARNVWSLLDAVADGETWALVLWSEWFKATKGKRAIVWSRGLKARFGLGEVSDEEIAQQDVDGQVLEVVPSGRWLSWCRSLTPAGVVEALAHLEELERCHAP